MCLSMRAPPPLWPDIRSRIYGYDSKVGIINRAMHGSLRLPKNLQQLINDTISAVGQWKTYRDAVVHAKISDPKSIIAEGQIKKGDFQEVLVSKDALNGLYDRIVGTEQEMRDVLAIFHATAYAKRFMPYPISDQDRQQAEQAIPGYVARLRALQKKRQSLQPLPKFPDEHSDRPRSEKT
jgi:hypothetical protein